MKVLGNLDIVKKSDINLPFGAGIQNETDSQDGTPVVDDIMQDVLSNLYQLLKLAKITPTDNFDSNATQYQIVEAIKQLPNSLNDIEQVLSLDGDIWMVPFDLSILPNKYFFVARASDNYIGGRIYSFQGTGPTTYGFSSTGFSSGDEMIVVIDHGTVRAYSLTSTITQKEVFTIMGAPLSFNDGNEIYYFEDGKLITDRPSIKDLQVVLQSEYEDSSLVLIDVFIIGGFALCYCFIPSGNQYFFRQFSLDDLSASLLVTLVGASFGTSDDFAPYVYVSGSSLFITNALNYSAIDLEIVKLNYDPADPSLTLALTIALDGPFAKTSNAVIKTNLLYTMIDGILTRYSLISGVRELVGAFPVVSGQLFWFNGSAYYSSGEVAKKWF